MVYDKNKSVYISDGIIAEVKASCGRYYLDVAGVVVAMEGDVCRASLPEECYDSIPEKEMECASIGGKRVKDLPIQLVRFFRRDYWTLKMLQCAADKVNYNYS